MKPSAFFLIISLCLSFKTIAQLHDATWMMGFATGPGPGDEFGISEISFREGSFSVKENFDFRNGFTHNNTIFSDSSGNMISMFNGYFAFDASFNKMKNGDSLWFDEEPNIFSYCDDGFPQGGLFLPWPGHPDSLFLFYNSLGNIADPSVVIFASLHLQYALIRLSGNNGLGEVAERRVVVLQDTIQSGRLLAVKHANGRDWWLPINEKGTNRFYHYLIDPGGIRLVSQQIIGDSVLEGRDHAAFSPDGKWFAMVNCHKYEDPGAYLNLYEFDRCTGQFMNHRQFPHWGVPAGGCAFSRNSRYLYVNFNIEMFQYDLWASDFEASKVLIGSYVPPPPDEFPAAFYQMQLAPDNKIYICATNGVRYLHVIHRPDEPGLACQFERIGIRLPVNNLFSVTYNPYWRLGPLDGSPCDTLGLDNRPIAWWRSDRDTLNSLRGTFHDLSYYEPTSWLWDFGDGQGSTEQHPAHEYAQAGDYKVCLTVSNTNSSHTLCRVLRFGSVSAKDPEIKSTIQVSPNPFQQRLSVSLSASLRSPVFHLCDVLGHLVLKQPLAFGITEVETEGLAAGIYFWQVSAGGEVLQTGKVVKM